MSNLTDRMLAYVSGLQDYGSVNYRIGKEPGALFKFRHASCLYDDKEAITKDVKVLYAANTKEVLLFTGTTYQFTNSQMQFMHEILCKDGRIRYRPEVLPFKQLVHHQLVLLQQ